MSRRPPSGGLPRAPGRADSPLQRGDNSAYADVAALHRKVDESVCAAYSWPRSIAGNPDETNARLLALNQEIVAGKRPSDPFASLRM